MKRNDFLLCFVTFQVYIGLHSDHFDWTSPNFDNSENDIISPPVSKIIVNKNYTKAENVKKKLNKYYDLALLELSEDVDLATFTPACLARASDLTTFDNKTVLALGKNLQPPLTTYQLFLRLGKN